jgi:hypothetical protein
MLPLSLSPPPLLPLLLLLLLLPSPPPPPLLLPSPPRSFANASCGVKESPATDAPVINKVANVSAISDFMFLCKKITYYLKVENVCNIKPDTFSKYLYNYSRSSPVPKNSSKNA